MGTHLLVANQTLGGPDLRAVMIERAAGGQATVHVVVPATRSVGAMERIIDAYAGEPDGNEVRAELHAAQQRLDRELAWLRGLGVAADGEIGSSDPLAAACSAAKTTAYDEVILSTLPAGLSRWLGMDLPSRLERALGRPVTHVVGPASD